MPNISPIIKVGKKAKTFQCSIEGWSNASNISSNISTSPIAPSQGAQKARWYACVDVKMNEIVRRNVWQGGQTHTTFHRTLRTMEKFGEVFELHQPSVKHFRTRFSPPNKVVKRIELSQNISVEHWSVKCSARLTGA